MTDGSLGKCIEELREALGPASREHIRNVRVRGYIFDTDGADIEQRGALPVCLEHVDVVRVTVEEQEELPDVTEVRTLPPAVPARRASNRLRTAAVVAGGMLTLLLAVLPFVNESGNSEIEYLSDGMTESLTNSLARLPRLSVKARSSVFRYKGQAADPQRIAAELSVQAVLWPARATRRGLDALPVPG